MWPIRSLALAISVDSMQRDRDLEEFFIVVFMTRSTSASRNAARIDAPSILSDCFRDRRDEMSESTEAEVIEVDERRFRMDTRSSSVYFNDFAWKSGFSETRGPFPD